ncbi:hypothetical protein ACIBUR_05805 [Streptomyces anulatus]
MIGEFVSLRPTMIPWRIIFDDKAKGADSASTVELPKLDGENISVAAGLSRVPVIAPTTASVVCLVHWRSAAIRKPQYSPGGCHRALGRRDTSPKAPVMPAEQYGRWTGTDNVDTSQASDPAAAVALACALHALNDISKRVAAGPAAAVVAIPGPAARCSALSPPLTVAEAFNAS